MHMIAAAVIAAHLASPAPRADLPPRLETRLAYEVSKYWVYCIGDKISVEMWDLTQMKVRRGSNVCQLYESTSVSSAQDWARKNFPTATCSCEP